MADEKQAPITVHDPNSTPNIDPSGEFPTAWHREAHIAALERELEGREVAEDKDGAAAAKAELARLGQKTSRPARAAEKR